MIRFVRGLIVVLALTMIGAVVLVCVAGAQSDPAQPASYQISGTVRNGKTLLPGVTVTAANTLTGKKYATVSSPNGTFQFKGLARGRYVVRLEFMGFAAVTEEVVLNPENSSGKIETQLILASRQQEQAPDLAAQAAGRGFQSLAMNNTFSGLAGEGAGAFSGGSNDATGMPLNGGSLDSPTESLNISGAPGRTQDFGGGSEQDLEDRVQEFRDRMQREGGNLQTPGQTPGQTAGPGGGQGPGGGPGGPGGPVMGGPIAFGRFGRNFNINQPHGFLYVQDGNSALDARPYSLTGISTDKASYNQARFGANLGGPLNIPKLFNGGNKWFFFAGWNGSRGTTPYDHYATVPTLAERQGDFSGTRYNDGTPVAIFNPQTQQPYQYNGVLNVIDPANLSSAAKALLQYIPLPNIATTASGQNYHNVTSGESSSDSISLRLIHNFGSGAGTFAMPLGGPGGGGGAVGGGGRRGRRQNNVNFGLNWSRSSIDTVGIFPSLNGGTGTQGLNASAGWVYGRGKLTNNLRFNYNHSHVSATNLYSGLVDVAGDAGIGGISTDPFGFGLPGIGFTSFGGLSDPTPRRELDQTYTVSDTVGWNHGRHIWRFGGDYRRILQSFRSARNANGSFVFTGFATGDYAGGTEAPDTGYDFADFLLGLPQQTSLQSGTNSYDFRANSFDLYAQDDWRVFPKLTLLLGVRYEYNGPYTEAQNRIVNLDVGANFGSAAPVEPGESGAAFGTYPASLLAPDRNNVAPRLGLAWRPANLTVVRMGYGINYNLAQYGTVIQNFAFQPPFANTQTNSATDPATSTLTLADGFTSTPGTVTNNYAIDPNYRLGYVQIWNLDVQRTLPHGFLLNAGYNGAKGTHLDVQRAILAAGAQPFIYESSAGDSILHAASIRVRKRMAAGLGFSASYAFSKSIDDASSIGLGTVVVAQDPFDIAADRSVSPFYQKHKFTGSWNYDLPFGENHRLAAKGFVSHVLDGWQWSGSATLGSGFYFTPNVRGGTVDITRGVSGSERANYVPGQPIALADPTSLEWFNTAAFCTAAASPGCLNPDGSPFGDAGRNIIEGPAQFTLNMALSKTIQVRDNRALELRLQANNVFNLVDFTGINTTVNSLAFGEVVSAAAMRRISLVARFRF